MKKLFLLLAFLLAWSGSVYATDVTITASQIASFNPSGIGSDRTITVGVTNNSLSVTSSAAFPSAIVGLGGFQVNIGGTQYIVSSVTSTSLMTLTTVYAGSTGSASMVLYKYVLLQIYADRAFQPAGETYVVQPGAPGSGAWYKRVAASIINDGATNTLWIPSLVLDSTTDAITTTNQARYFAGFYRPDGSLVQAYDCFTAFQLRADTPTTWTAICAYNAPSGIVPPNRDAYSKTEIDARFPSCTAGQMLYYAVSGNAQACLTVGSGLSIAGGTITATGGGGGSGTVTSVAMTVPNILSVSGSPITTSGTLALSLATQSANTVFAGPTTGGAATPTFRALVAADLTGALTDVMRVQNVKEGYGCVGDGSTSDQTCIVNAIAAANSSTTKKIVYFPEGSYRITAAISVPSGVTLRGAGAKSIITTTTSLAGAVFSIASSATDTVIERLAIAPSAAQQGILVGATSTRVIIRDIVISNITADASAGTPASTSGVYVTAPSTDIRIINSFFSGNGFLNSTDGADIYFAAGATPHAGAFISGNKISGGSSKFSIGVFDASSSRIIGNWIDQNNKTNGGNNDGYGIVVYGSTAVINRNDVSDNYITNTAGSGIYIVDSYYTSVTSNQLFDTVKQQTDVSLPAAAISNNGGDWGTITGNTIKTSTQSGISINGRAAVATAHGIIVNGNTIDGAAGNAGVQIKNTCNECQINNTTVTGSVRGIYSTVAHDGLRISNFSVYDPSSNGVYLAQIDNSTLSNIKVYSATSQAVIILAGARNNLVNLTIKDGASTGLDFRGTRSMIVGSEITGNLIGVEDSGTNNQYFANKVQGNTTEGSFGSTPGSQQITITSGTTISVIEADFFILTHASGTSVTGLTGYSGQNPLAPIKTFLATNGNTTFVNSGALRLQGNQNLTLQANETISFYYYNGGWYEVGSNASARTFVQNSFVVGTPTYGVAFEGVKAAASMQAILRSTTSTAFSGYSLYNDAGSTATANLQLLNSAYASSVLSGATTGQSANLYTTSTVDLNIGTNAVRRLTFTGAGVMKLDLGSDATGDIFYRNSSGNFTRLAIGTAAQCLVVSGGLPAWGSCSAGSGITGTIAANQVAYGTGVDTIGGVAGFTFDGTSALTLGVAGTSVGSVAFKNATSGTITVSPVTGALGTVTLSLPAATDTLVGKATTDTFTNKTIAASSNVLGGVTMTLGSDADGDTYYRSSNVLTRLAKGTAGQCLMMNGGATAPTWGACDGTITWDVIANPIANQTLTMSTFTTTHNYTTGLLAYNWTGNTSTSSAFTITHNNTSATGYVLDVGATSASSLVKPLVVRAKNAVVLNTDVFGDVTFQPVAQTSGSPTLFTITGPAHTGATAGTEVNDVNINLNRTITFATGALSENRSVRFQAPTLAAAASSTISDAINVDINSPTAGTNATITRSTALRVKPSSAAHHGIWADGTVSYTGDAFAAGLSGTKIVRMVGSNGTLNVVLQANGALATNATDGFTYLPSSAGTPTGTPTSYTGAVPVEIDTTNSRFYGYFGGAWVNLTGSGGGTPGGSNTQVQYNNAGAFGGISGFTSDGTNVTAGSGNLRATSPRITTGLNDANGNELFLFTATGSAVNEFTVTNAATGGNPQLSATGGDTDVGLDFLVKAAGVYRFLATTSGPADVRLFEDADNGTNYASLIAPASMAANRVLTLPDATDTLVGKATTDSFTNKTLTSSTNVLGGVTMTLGSDANGDIYTRASGVLSRVGIGATGDVLTVSGGAPVWAAPVADTWDIIGDPLANVTHSMSSFNTTFNFTTGLWTMAWSGNTSTNVVVPISHSNTTATGDLVKISTSASVSVKPFRVTPRANDAFLVDHLGNVVHGNAALSTSATDGFFYLTTAAGVPSGTPATTYTGRAPVLVDTTNSRLYGYFGGAWVNLSGSGGGTTINPTDGVMPYRSNSTTFADSPLSVSSGRLSHTPTAQSSGAASYFTLNIPADTGMTASTESIGFKTVTATRQWSTGALTTQRENVFAAPTYAFVGASTLTTAVTLDASSPIAGTNATLTNSYAGRFNASAAGHVALVANSASSPTSNIFETQINGTNTSAFRVTKDGLPSTPKSGYSNTELYGAGITFTPTTGDSSVIVGQGISITANKGGSLVVIGQGITLSNSNSFADQGGVLIGQGISMSGSANWRGLVAIGKGMVTGSDVAIDASVQIGTLSSLAAFSQASNNSTLIGYGATIRGTDNVAIGTSASITGPVNNNVVIGTAATSTAASSVVLGKGATTSTANVFVAGASSDAISNVYFGKGITNATPTAYTINGTGGSGSNIAGANVILAGGKHTGTPSSPTTGSVVLSTSIVGASASTANTLVERYIVNGARKTLTDASTNLFEIALPTLKGCMGTIRFEIFASDGTDVQVRRGTVQFSAVNKAAAYTSEITVLDESVSASAGTLTATWAITSGTNKITISTTPSGSLTETTYYIIYTIENNSEQAVTVL